VNTARTVRAGALTTRAARWSRYVANQVYDSLVGRDYEWDLMPLGADQGLGGR
jgi:hypothetical protein